MYNIKLQNNTNQQHQHKQQQQQHKQQHQQHQQQQQHQQHQQHKQQQHQHQHKQQQQQQQHQQQHKQQQHQQQHQQQQQQQHQQHQQQQIQMKSQCSGRPFIYLFLFVIFAIWLQTPSAIHFMTALNNIDHIFMTKYNINNVNNNMDNSLVAGPIFTFSIFAVCYNGYSAFVAWIDRSKHHPLKKYKVWFGFGFGYGFGFGFGFGFQFIVALISTKILMSISTSTDHSLPKRSPHQLLHSAS